MEHWFLGSTIYLGEIDGRRITINVAIVVFTKIYRVAQLVSEKQKQLFEQNREMHPITETSFSKKRSVDTSWKILRGVGN